MHKPGLFLVGLLLLSGIATAETSFDSGALAPGASFQYTFEEVLESGFYYTCSFHGSDDTMVHVVDDSDGMTTTHQVSVTGDNSGLTVFSPQHLVIEVGDTVIWSNDSDVHHTVTYDDAATRAASGQDEHHQPGDDHDHDDHDHGEKSTPSVGVLGLTAMLAGLAVLHRRA